MGHGSIQRSTKILFTICVALAGSACHKKQSAKLPSAPAPAATTATTPRKPNAAPLAMGYTEQGVASWYGVPYHGRPAADGEIYDMETLVAAHRLMPFNTWLRVTNLSNQKSVVVRIIDRGPFVDGRIIDLSKAAARQIDLLGPGIGQVKLEVIAPAPDVAANDFYAVQVGAFAIYANAERIKEEYQARFGFAAVQVKQGPTPVWGVLVGKQKTIDGAQQIAAQLRGEGKDVFLVRLDQVKPAEGGAQPARELGSPDAHAGTPSAPALPKK